MFDMVKETQSVPTAQIASDLGRDYEAVLNFRHDLQELCSDRGCPVERKKATVSYR
jgi:hypothetical protein